jgi:hypothetical protein
MMMNPAFLEAESAVVRVYAALEGRSMPRRKPKEQAKKRLCCADAKQSLEEREH